MPDVADVREPRPSGSAVQRAMAAHLGSRDVAKVIYGAIIGLALVVALSRHPPTAVQTAAAVIATAVAVGLAEVYSEFVGTEARTQRRVRRTELHELAMESVAVALGAGFPAVFFILSALHVMEVGTAFTLAKWTGLGLICLYGYLAARLAGCRLSTALLHTAVLGAIGGGLIAIKALLH